MDIEETTVEAGPIACTTARVAWAELGTKIRPMFDQVYAFIRAQGLTTGARGEPSSCDPVGASGAAGLSSTLSASAHGERSEPAHGGHNVCVYASPRPDGVELTVGVQLLRPFETTKDGVRCGRTPAGRAVTTFHTGEYSGLGKAHDALFGWARAKNIQPAGPSWEVYGDWEDDPAKRTVDVFLLLEAP